MLTILQGDVIEQLCTLPDESVHCCVTSPPYWSLRDYSTEGQIGLEKTPDCGRPLARLIVGLASSQVAFVRQRLSDAGLLDAFPSGMGGTTQQRSQSRSEVQDAHPKTSNDELECDRRASGNPDNANHPDSGLQTEIHDKQASCNPSLSPENDRPSNSGDERQQDANYAEGDYPNALPRAQSLDAMPEAVAYPTERDLSTVQLSSEHFASSSEIADSQPLRDRQALREQQDSSQDYHGDSAKSSRKSSHKSKIRDRDTFSDIGDKLWAWYSLPQDVTRFYESQLCGECYVCKMVDVFRAVRRVLRKDGTLWLNLGDSFNSVGGSFGGDNTGRGVNIPREKQSKNKTLCVSLKPKDLCGIPWRLAFALQADGWWLRSDIIWAKPNPMPESVTDRPTKAHEYLFLLTKASSYYYDSEAIKERSCDEPGTHRGGSLFRATPDADKNGDLVCSHTHRGGIESLLSTGNRNKRSVWTVATAPYPEAHFATYPPDLIKPCIMAGTSAKGCCAKCGSPWERIIEKSGGTIGKSWHDHSRDLESGMTQARHSGGVGNAKDENGDSYQVKTIGWQPTCKCCELYCSQCCVVIASDEDEKSITKGWSTKTMLELQGQVFRTKLGQQMVFAGMRGEVDCEASPDDNGKDNDDEGIRDALPSESSERKGRRLCDGASRNHGETDWSLFDEGRSSSPSKPQKGRQSLGEFGVDDEANPRPDAETETFEVRTVPALPQNYILDWLCGTCRNPLDRRTPETKPCVTLDCFAGSGTTGAVALEFGRKAILIELNPKYVELIKTRCNVTPGLALA